MGLYVEISHQTVSEGQTIRTNDLGDSFVFQWKLLPSQRHPQFPPWYTLALIDLDAPYPEDPSHAPYLHFLMVNIAEREDGGKIVVDYQPPAPPPDSPPHRYLFLLLQQPSSWSTVEVPPRENFEWEGWPPMHLLESLLFYGVHEEDIPSGIPMDSFRNPEDFESREENITSVYPYDAYTLEDLRILGRLYSIRNAESLDRERLKEVIEHRVRMV